MTGVTLPQGQASSPPAMPAVECARGHWNDPYPNDGKCVECGLYLPANPTALKSEDMDAINKRKAAGGKSVDEIAHAVLEDEGVPWKEATEGLRQLSLQFAKTRAVKTLELIYQQIGALKAKPKSAEGDTVVEYQVSLTAGTVDGLKRSLADLESLL